MLRHNFPIHPHQVRNYPSYFHNPQPANSQHHSQLSHDQNGHHAQVPSFLAHQQNPYSSAPHTNGLVQLSSNHLQSTTPSHSSSAYSKPVTEHWAEQLDRAEQSKRLKGPNQAAKLFGVETRDNAQKSANASGPAKDNMEGDVNRSNRDDEEKAKHAWTAIDLGGHQLRNLAPSIFNYEFLEALHISHNNLVELPPAIGQLHNLRLLDVSHNQLKELPPEMGMLTQLQELLLFENAIHELPFELGSLFRLKVLGIEGNPLQENLKTELMQNGSNALIKLLRENAPEGPPPPDREWILLDETVASGHTMPDGPETFTAMTFNILCNHSATESQYGYAPSQVLTWEYRSNLIVKEIKQRLPDILCLQEVDTNAFEDLLRPSLAFDGYKGVHWVKSRARSMSEGQSRGVDGCATFYKSDRYILLDKQTVDIVNIAINRPDMRHQLDIFNRVMDKDNVALVTFFEDIMTGSRIIVANAHLTWSPRFQDVKLVQTAILLDFVNQVSEKYAHWPARENKKHKPFAAMDWSSAPRNGSPVAEKDEREPAPSMSYASNTAIPMLICGDFNSKPDSGVYEALSTGSVSGSHEEFMDKSYGDITKHGISHPFSLQSAYSTIGELNLTNHTDRFSAVIDYIWYGTSGLQVSGLLGPVDDRYLKRVPGFPNHHFPSDHISLLAEFQVKRKKQVVRRDQAGAVFSTGAN